MLFLCASLGACGSERPPFAGAPGGRAKDAGADSSFLVIGPPPPPAADAGGYCGNLIIPIVSDRPNLYFVLDASGSMAEPIAQPNAGPIRLTKYTAALGAIESLLRAVGHRVSYGAALFPGSGSKDGCAPGAEVFATEPGDPVSYALAGTAGPTLDALHRTLVRRPPSGLTPTAASLVALESTLEALPGKTYAFLLTDGAPNCGAGARCDAASCSPNIEGGCGAAPGVNCCDPALGLYDYRWCLDADPTVAAVAELATNGIQTFVVGMPGTGAYASLLGRLAVAGRTARPTEPYYYPAENADDLVTTLQQVGLAVAVSCDVPLKESPPDWDLVNVYFDQTVVPRDPTNGWRRTGGPSEAAADAADAHAGSPGSIRIVGDSCDLLKAGAVLQLQVVAGCPSLTR